MSTKLSSGKLTGRKNQAHVVLEKILVFTTGGFFSALEVTADFHAAAVRYRQSTGPKQKPGIIPASVKSFFRRKV